MQEICRPQRKGRNSAAEARRDIARPIRSAIRFRASNLREITESALMKHRSPTIRNPDGAYPICRCSGSRRPSLSSDRGFPFRSDEGVVVRQRRASSDHAENFDNARAHERMKPMTVKSTPILLVGSVPLRDEAEVFAEVAGILGERVAAIPDGETGARTNWINWQKSVMDQAPMIERRQHVDGYGAVQVDLYSEKKDHAGERAFPPLGYARAALASYATFRAMKEEGRIAPGTRFQVALPTPFAPMMSFIEPGSFHRVEPLYVAAMHRELDEILSAIPHEELAVQWDAALEFAVLEGVFPAPVTDFRSLVGRMVELGSWVPDAVAMGFHLCYGDANHKHFKDPDSTSLMVQVMNDLARRVVRTIDWFHLPVPIARDDDAYFKPLSVLKTSPDTQIYLGLAHVRDGREGALRRATSARKFIKGFGIATECGLGRRPSETIVPLLRMQVEIAEAIDGLDA
ncbi:hypothetical protein SJA_C2-01220 [Sphingobium indicum UT26S]|uniref:Cobalamin-independent methionine synthase MetE C-terminal/archaeal domain-containing protein n=2 Tax=Sphingomonadaceae TaxID=41297 RepID=D4Z7L6_SPHIU|nr:hypothetical protein SJA_C2-01220 [Sphingobium indicum UT26S]